MNRAGNGYLVYSVALNATRPTNLGRRRNIFFNFANADKSLADDSKNAYSNPKRTNTFQDSSMCYKNLVSHKVVVKYVCKPIWWNQACFIFVPTSVCNTFEVQFSKFVF